MRSGSPAPLAKSNRAALAVTLALASVGAAGAAAQPASGMRPDDFAAAAAGADQYEIMAGHTALAESHDPAIRAFAARIVRDHAAALDALRQAALRSGLTPPAAIVRGDQEALLAALQSVRGADFDRAYARQQVLAHVQARAVEQGYAREGSDPNLRQAAQADLPMIKDHLQIAQSLQRANGD